MLFLWLQHKTHWQIIYRQWLLWISLQISTCYFSFSSAWLVPRNLILDSFANLLECFKLLLPKTYRFNSLHTRLPNIRRLAPLHTVFALAPVLSKRFGALDGSLKFSANNFTINYWFFFQVIRWLPWFHALNRFSSFERFASTFRLRSIYCTFIRFWVISFLFWWYLCLYYNWL